jgi:hypothetical protein
MIAPEHRRTATYRRIYAGKNRVPRGAHVPLITFHYKRNLAPASFQSRDAMYCLTLSKIGGGIVDTSSRIAHTVVATYTHNRRCDICKVAYGQHDIGVREIRLSPPTSALLQGCTPLL